MSTQQQQLDFIERYLVYDIFKYFGSGAELEAHSVECSNGLDGFMSALYTVQLDMSIAGRKQTEVVLVKFMKGTEEFRESSNSYIQFGNETFAYAEILPAYEHLLRASRLSSDVVTNWVPRCYYAKFGQVDGLGSGRESVLALKHLKGDGYQLGPRLTLRRDQLEAMVGLIGPFHALGYATRILQPQVHARLRSGIAEMPFVSSSGRAIFDVLYRVAFDRFYEFYDRKKEQLLGEAKDEGFGAAIERLRSKYFANPTHLLEWIRTTSRDEDQPDSYFATILHGDYNRNNVLFHYGVDDKVDGIRAIDFQELRFSTTAIDLSFFLYMNTPSEGREEIYADLLGKYHQNMIEMLELVVRRNQGELSEERVEQLLKDYSFERFQAHFKRYAFYGVLVCMHFMPWLLGSERDCAELSRLFDTDMHGPAFHQLSLDIAGDVANEEIFKTMRHAYEQGYMEEI
ncbi:uncharacterized protein [Drosophila kikkawai]|uniref:Uncharacterized protein LOC108083402 n=1 Tax=Drosophila kikkawai TaxID=30033 RepID=A0A6P4IZW5_DROKI|nr:uncharacterized protein LOC108083402 [Drosophila kikkawai]XP_017034642.1 uncharacterized protein LOC108083402 [Drosophila kikkawai]XP_017034643.1 uncharacterized protein LOC108083402 [Drosophila kikkawai]